MQFSHNPTYRAGRDQHGRNCFFIYNDDGTPAMGASGQRYCYSEEKAQQMVGRARPAGAASPPRAAPEEAPPPRAAPEEAKAKPAAVHPNLATLERRFTRLKPILDHHLVMSHDQPHWGGKISGRAPTVKGIEPRRKYAVIHSGMRTDRHGKTKVVPEFVVNLETLELSRADENGQPRDFWNFGHIDEVISRGVTLKPRSGSTFE